MLRSPEDPEVPLTHLSIRHPTERTYRGDVEIENHISLQLVLSASLTVTSEVQV